MVPRDTLCLVASGSRTVLAGLSGVHRIPGFFPKYEIKCLYQDNYHSTPLDVDSRPPDPTRLSVGIGNENGQLGWQKATGYGQRGLVETTMGRYKALIGARLRACGFAQQSEAAIGMAGLNLMLAAARPNPSVLCEPPHNNDAQGLVAASTIKYTNAALMCSTESMTGGARRSSLQANITPI